MPQILHQPTPAALFSTFRLGLLQTNESIDWWPHSSLTLAVSERLSVMSAIGRELFQIFHKSTSIALFSTFRRMNESIDWWPHSSLTLAVSERLSVTSAIGRELLALWSICVSKHIVCACFLYPPRILEQTLKLIR